MVHRRGHWWQPFRLHDSIVLQSSCPFLIIPARTLKARDKVLLCLHFGMSVYPCFGFSFWMTNIDSCWYTPNSSHAGTECTCLFVIWAVCSNFVTTYSLKSAWRVPALSTTPHRLTCKSSFDPFVGQCHMSLMDETVSVLLSSQSF